METKLNLENESKISDVKTSMLYLLLFYLVWALKELWLVKYIHLFDETTSAFLSALVKISVWIVPAWLYIKYYLNIDPINYLKLNVNVKKGIFWGLILSLLFGSRFVFEVYILNKQTFNFTLPLDGVVKLE